jgi:hypothetical protein
MLKRGVGKVLIVFLFIFISGCAGDVSNSDLWYKGITNANVPDTCLSYKEDVCGLFDCMVQSCWCDESSPELPILYETHIEIMDEQGAVDAVNAYLAELVYGGISTEVEKPEDMTVIRAVKLNTVFYNVFVEDDLGREMTYTVAVDGTILKTICGV